MKTKISFLIVLILWLAPIRMAANDWSSLYGEPRLFKQQPRFESRANELLYERIWPYLTANEQRALARVQLTFPLAEDGPLVFYSNGQSVVMPILSLLFWEDLCIAYAWLWANGYSLETVDEYITMLRYKDAAEFSGGRYPPPLTALQIPREAITTAQGYNQPTDPQVEELFLRFRNSGWAFILLHELGHIYYKHPGYNNIPTEQTRKNEEQADLFALAVMERTGTIPMGALLFFQALAYMLPSKGQFIAEGRYQSEEDWEQYLSSTEGTHPLTTRRLEIMALNLTQTADRVGSGPESETLRYIATRLISIIDVLEDVDL